MPAPGRKPVILVFGEDDNDREALKHLLHALRSDAPRIEKRAHPPVLVKGREAARARKNVANIAAQVARDSRRFDVRLVVAHEDADAVEPAHEDLAAAIEARLSAAGVSAVVAAVPAFEMEAWWFLWPDCVLAVNSRWRRPARTGRNVGRIPNAKEELRRTLRSKHQGKPTRDYEESDAPKIARVVRERDVVDRRDAVSRSFERFATKVRQAELS